MTETTRSTPDTIPPDRTMPTAEGAPPRVETPGVSMTRPDPKAVPPSDAEADAEMGSESTTGRGRGRYIVAAVIVLALVGAAVAVVMSRGQTGSSVSGGSNGAVETTTAKVEKRTLIKTDTVDGTLDFAASRPIVNQRSGTLTSAPDSGTVVERGQRLYTIDSRPVILFFGETPVYRSIDASSTPGPDIKQLEENLVALGFGGAIVVDETFDAATAYQLGQWETSVGLDGDGVVQLGELVFLPSSVRINDLKVTVGSSVPVGNEAVGVTSTTKVVTVGLDAAKAGSVKQGDTVNVTLPNGSTATGTVQSVGPKSNATTGGGRTPAAGGNAAAAVTTEAIVGLGENPSNSRIDTGPVKVKITNTRRDGVKAVPVTALVALAEGGYAVQLADGGKLVAAKPGLIADNWVEITSDVAEGASVVVPK